MKEVTPNETEPDMPVSALKSPVKAWVDIGLHGVRVTGSSNQ